MATANDQLAAAIKAAAEAMWDSMKSIVRHF